jgi:hypothetical protein
LLNPQHDRSSPDCVAKLFAALRTSNYRIQPNGYLDRCCAPALVLESKFLILVVKIVLQHNRQQSGREMLTARISDFGPNRPSAVHFFALRYSLFDHFVSEGEYLERNFEAYELRGLEVMTSSYLFGFWTRRSPGLAPTGAPRPLTGAWRRGRDRSIVQNRKSIAS